MYTIVILSLMVVSGVYLYRNRDRLKGIRSNIAAIGWTLFEVFERVIVQLEMFPWKEYLTPNHALISTIGVLALVTFFTSLKGTGR